MADTDPDDAPAADPSSSGAIVLHLSREEAELICEALESHIFWQLSDPHYRKDGFVVDPGSDDPDNAAAIRAADALLTKLDPLDPVPPWPRQS